MMKWSYQSIKRKPDRSPEAYYRQGIALECLGRHAEALGAFAAGLAQDPKSTQLLMGLVDAAMKSPLKDKLGPTYEQLKLMKLDKSPFVIISVIGQELLAGGYYASAVTVLESALRIGTCSLKLRGSVFSALSSAHWGLGNVDKAVACMQQDLAVAKSLGDQEGECRAHGNLGAAFFSKGNYKEALSNQRYQLVLAMKLKVRDTAARALSSLGHIYTAIGDYPNALASHKQCVLLLKQMDEKTLEAREIGNVGVVYLAMGDFDGAVECHNEHLKMAHELENRTEEARAYSNLGSAYHYKRNFDKAIAFHNQVLTVAQDLTDKTLEARAYAGLGHAARCMGDTGKAKDFHEKQLDNSLQTKDKVAEGRACSNLGIIYQQIKEYDAALKLHKMSLQIAKDLGDRASQGRAFGNIGNAYSALKKYELAIKFNKQELAISKEVNDRHSEASTHGNLAVAYQAMNMFEQALQHYQLHLHIAQELKDTSSEARALSNLGNFYSKREEFSKAVPFYEQFLILSQELQDVEGEGRACHTLGYAHYCLGNYREAIRYYDQDLALAKDLQDKTSMGRAYCNLGLAHKALANYSQALECQKYFLATTVMLKNWQGKFKALGNIGDVHLKMNNTKEAIEMFNQQLKMAKQYSDRALEGSAYGNLGVAHKLTSEYDKALGFHNQELTVRQEMNDLKGECRAHGNLGNVHMALGNYTNAYKCYEEQLDRARDLQDSAFEAQACGNLGITKMNMGHFDDAIGLFEQQLATLEQVVGNVSAMDKGRAFGNLGDCYEALSDYEEAVKCHEQFLSIVQQANNLQDQERAYRGLGNAHRAMGNLQQALVCFEKRLVVAHELDLASAKSSAYGELGCLHSLLGNFEQAISCLEHQLEMTQQMKNKIGEGDAACGLGGVYQQMGEFETALKYHEMDLNIAEETGNTICQCRAYGNLGLSHESLGNFEQAVRFQEQHLGIAAQMNDNVAKTLAYSSLGRVHHAIGNYTQAVQYLAQGLQIAEQLGRREDEAKICHRLGLALWGHGDLEDAQQQLYRAAELFENIRREAQISSDYKLSLFDLQTASYQALQRVLVALGHYEEALVVAERGRTRAFVDLLLERQTGSDSYHGSIDHNPVTIDQIIETVTKQKACVLYYSVAAGYLYSWLIMPEKGIVKFHEVSVSELESNCDAEADTQSLGNISISTTSLLDQYVGHVRESLGVESHIPSHASSRLSLNTIRSGMMSETESEADDLWQQHLEELGDKLNAEADRTGFLRIVNRNHVFNSSNYSLSSLFSFSGSASGLNASMRSGSTRSAWAGKSRTSWSGKPPLSALYDLLISPVEEVLPPRNGPLHSNRDLVLVLHGDLYLVPFAVLKGSQASDCLYERFNLMVVPSLRALQNNQEVSKLNRLNPDATDTLVVGNPKLPPAVMEQWLWCNLPAAEQEARVIAEMMGSKALVGAGATKEVVAKQLAQCEVIHFATHVSWKLSAIVLSPADFSTGSKSDNVHGPERMDLNDSSSDLSSSIDGGGGPGITEFLLTAADVLNIKLSAKLVVLSSGHTDDRAGRINTDGVVGLTRALLAAGARCVMYSLWPVPEMATKILMRSFYTSLLQGSRVSHALSLAMRSVQSTKQFSHPSNWASWVVVGSDVKLSSKVALMGHALCELVCNPAKCREAMRVVLHLVEKTLQRIQRGQKSAMYTTQQSIENKVGSITGWKDLLVSVGFRFEPEANGLPPAVFFPVADPGDRLTQCSASLQALLGLPQNTLTALSKLLHNFDAGEALNTLLFDVNQRYSQKDGVQIPVSVKLWRLPGCHEFLASIGFDLIDVGKDEVTVRTSKQANKRILQFALQSLVALFDTQEAPRTLILDSSSSMESLTSSGSATSTSNFSKGSSPPTSPAAGKKRSIFNPAEVERMPTAAHINQTSFSPTSSLSSFSSVRGSGRAEVSLNLARQNNLRSKYSSPTGLSKVEDAFRNGGPHGMAMNVSESGDDSPRVISIETHDFGNKDDSSSTSSNAEPPHTYQRQSLFERGSVKGYFPQQPNYSTSSQSEGEDAQLSDHGDLQRFSYNRSSCASGSSTLTLKSNSSGIRRNRTRSSMASTRSSASDRTITNESTVSGHSKRSKDSERSKDRELSSEKKEMDKTDIVKDDSKSLPPALRQSGHAKRTESDSSAASLSSDAMDKPMLDPTTLAMKVMMETQQQIHALNHMQQASLSARPPSVKEHPQVAPQKSPMETTAAIPENEVKDWSEVPPLKSALRASSRFNQPSSDALHEEVIEKQLNKMDLGQVREVCTPPNSGLPHQPAEQQDLPPPIPTTPKPKVFKHSMPPLPSVTSQSTMPPPPSYTKAMQDRPPVPAKPKHVMFMDVMTVKTNNADSGVGSDQLTDEPSPSSSNSSYDVQFNENAPVNETHEEAPSAEVTGGFSHVPKKSPYTSYLRQQLVGGAPTQSQPSKVQAAFAAYGVAHTEAIPRPDSVTSLSSQMSSTSASSNVSVIYRPQTNRNSSPNTDQSDHGDSSNGKYSSADNIYRRLPLENTQHDDNLYSSAIEQSSRQTLAGQVQCYSPLNHIHRCSPGMEVRNVSDNMRLRAAVDLDSSRDSEQASSRNSYASTDSSQIYARSTGTSGDGYSSASGSVSPTWYSSPTPVSSNKATKKLHNSFEGDNSQTSDSAHPPVYTRINTAAGGHGNQNSTNHMSSFSKNDNRNQGWEQENGPIEGQIPYNRVQNNHSFKGSWRNNSADSGYHGNYPNDTCHHGNNSIDTVYHGSQNSGNNSSLIRNPNCNSFHKAESNVVTGGNIVGKSQAASRWNNHAPPSSVKSPARNQATWYAMDSRPHTEERSHITVGYYKDNNHSQNTDKSQLNKPSFYNGYTSSPKQAAPPPRSYSGLINGSSRPVIGPSVISSVQRKGATVSMQNGGIQRGYIEGSGRAEVSLQSSRC